MSRKTATPINDEAEAEVAEVTEEVTFSAKELATELGLDPKTFRRWLRAHTADRANKGGRWIFTAETKDAILTAYASKAAGTEPTLNED